MKTITVRVPETFVPKEAHAMAANFRAKASEVRNLANQLRQVGSTLQSTWEGNSKNNFMGSFQPAPSELDTYAQWLEEKARQLDNFKVTIWHTEQKRV